MLTRVDFFGIFNKCVEDAHLEKQAEYPLSPCGNRLVGVNKVYGETVEIVFCLVVKWIVMLSTFF